MNSNLNRTAARPSPYVTVTRTTARGTTSSTFTPANSWTQRCYCLASPNDTHTPDKDSDFTLTRAGLGLKKIKFTDKNGNHQHFINSICCEFPKLKSQNGAICLWKCTLGGSGNRPLEKLKVGNSGYAIPELKKQIKSGTLYITPMQSSLPLAFEAPLTVPNAIGSYATALCVKCDTDVPLNTFSSHVNTCNGRSDDSFNDDGLMVPSNSKHSGSINVDSHCGLLQPRQLDIEYLKTIFPHTPSFEIEDALKRSICVADAVNCLLDNTTRGTCAIYLAIYSQNVY